MSAFVVDHKTIDRIVTFVVNDKLNRNGTPLHGRIAKLFEEVYQWDLALDYHQDALAVELLAMNQDAVMQRYPDCDATNLPGPIDPPPYNGYSLVPGTLVQVYKSMGCLIYQCSEGDVPEHKLYKALDKAHDILAHTIVSKLEAYEMAKWG